MFILETNHTSKAHCIFDLPSLGFDTTVKKKQHKNSNKGCQSNINTTNHLPDLKKTQSSSPLPPQWANNRIQSLPYCTAILCLIKKQQRHEKNTNAPQHNHIQSI